MNEESAMPSVARCAAHGIFYRVEQMRQEVIIKDGARVARYHCIFEEPSYEP